MELQQLIALALVAAVTLLFATRVVPRAVAGLVGALAVAFWAGIPAVLGTQVPEVFLVTAGLMVLAGFLKRSGLASWFALAAVKAARGRPTRILLASGLLCFVVGAFLGPMAAVALVVPVSLLLAVELDVPTLPFVLVLSWASLLGGATVMTAQPGNLWVATALGIDGGRWLARLAPLTLAALAATLGLGAFVFRKTLRATNERRARVLEFDEYRSLGNLPLVIKTVVVLVLVALGLALAPLFALSPGLIVVTGAAALLLLDGPGAVDRSLSDLDGGTLLFFGGLMAVVGALAASGLPRELAERGTPDATALLWGTAALGAFVDQGALAGILVPFLKAWPAELWPAVILGSTLGAGVTVWGAASCSVALGLSSPEGRKVNWKDFSLYGLAFAGLNLAVVSLLNLVLFR